jgi:hypothetical protein
MVLRLKDHDIFGHIKETIRQNKLDDERIK